MPYADKNKQYEAIRNNSRTVTVRFINSTDAEILEWLVNQEHPSTAIKKVLKEAIKDGRC